MKEGLTEDAGKSGSAIERVLVDRPQGPKFFLALIISLFSVSLAFYHLFIAYAGSIEAHTFRSTHLAFMMVLAFIVYPTGRKSWNNDLNVWFIWDAICILGTVIIQVYTLYDINEFFLRRGDLTNLDIYMGTALIILLLEAARRAVGWAIVFIAALFVTHTAFSNYFPGIFYGPPSSWFTIIDYLFMRENGVYGIPLMVMATYIFLFIFFGSLLVQCGGGRLFINVALALTGHRIGGPAKAAVVSSAIMASISGSAVANVVTTGTFTIPLMKRIGYKPHFAGAVEACASSGGQIMPPIMGAAAFIIAEFVGRPYLDVAISAFFPALMYFFSIMVMVHFEARKTNLATIPREQLPSLKEEMKRGSHLFISLLVIIGTLVAGYTAMFAAFWAIISIIALSFIRKETRLTPMKLLLAMEDGAKKSIPVALACATAGIIVGSIYVSGVGLKFTTLIVVLAHGKLWIALVLTMMASFILGMGLPTTAVYITVAALVTPFLIEMGVAPMAAHLFAFYYGLVSMITPPVALAAFAAAGIANSEPMKTGFHACRIGLAKYVIPLVFVYAPGMLLMGSLMETVVGVSGGFLGVFALTIATEGFLYNRVGIFGRLVAAFIALLLFNSDIKLYFMGLISLVGFVVFYWFQKRRVPKAKP